MISDGFPLGLRISLDLRQMCLELFRELDEFGNPKTLTTFVRKHNLTMVLIHIPRQEELVFDLLIDRLMEWGKSPQEPALLELITALEKEYQNKHQAEACKNLRNSLETWLVTAPRFGQAHDYEALITLGGKQPQRVSKSAEQWIDDAENDLEELALRITLCVFSGTTFANIESAKNSLLASLQELQTPATPTTSPPTPSLPIMKRLAKAGAEESESRDTDRQKVIELTNPALGVEALNYVWRMYRETEWRKRFVRWLSEHAGEEHAAAVRMRAAVGVGRLAIIDYRHFRDHLFSDWVKENTRTFRMALGMALGTVAHEESMAPEVQRLLKVWSHSERKEERWAALRAYIFVGPYCQPPREIIESWRHIAASEPPTVTIEFADFSLTVPNPLHMSLLDAVMQFFVLVAGMPETRRESILTGVLEGLNQWIKEKKPDAELGLFIFVLLAGLIGRSADEPESVPSFLLLQQIDPDAKHSEFRQQLTQFFSRAFSSTSMILHTNQVLCDWLKWINKLPANSESYDLRIQTLLTDLVAADASGRMRGKVMSCLRSCRAKGSVERAAAVLETV